MHGVFCCLGARNTSETETTKATEQADSGSMDNAFGDAYLAGAVTIPGLIPFEISKFNVNFHTTSYICLKGYHKFYSKYSPFRLKCTVACIARQRSDEHLA